MKRFRMKEWISIQLAKNPGRMVLLGILAFNIAFVFLSAFIISAMSLSGTEQMGFLEAAFYTVTMILDAGCISAVVKDIGTSGVVIAVICLCVIIIGMITFTGAVIGYVTNFISEFISNANTGTRKLHISNHTVILNWNTRASEIINDLLFSGQKEKVVILVNSRKEEIKKEISERLSETVAKENKKLHDEAKDMSFFKRFFYTKKHKTKMTVTFIVREGDVFSLKQLKDIQLNKAKAIIILGSDSVNTLCRYETKIKGEDYHQGNSQTIKTLMQVADITASDDSVSDQRIIVEITDPWTQDIVNKIIRSKEVKGRCNIIPVFVNQILGQILSQFSLMPELNTVYIELFSNKGPAFYAEKGAIENEDEYIAEYIKTHRHAIPLSSLDANGEPYFFYSTAEEEFINKVSEERPLNYEVKLNPNYWIDKKNVIILGHNSDCDQIMEGFSAFICEWGYNNITSEELKKVYEGEEVLRVTVVDDKENLEKMGYYQQYPFVKETVVADIYDQQLICDTINRVISYGKHDTSILILSDDNALSEDIDSNALANLIYVQDIVKDKIDENPDFDIGSIDIIVEIIDPKHHDLVNSYDINNIVISNRYISKMITQIGEKDAIYNFYNDILTYDVETSAENFNNKEVYAKKVKKYFSELPAPCKADELVRAVYNTSLTTVYESGETYPALVLGYVKKSGKMVIFSGDLSQVDVALEKDDKIILYTPH
ncbi:MAG: hypothetical protein IJH40_07895 [Ruminococcus sp.]|uniref:hypothetical protein n=1 Tax=Ruminococcus sp. TaxID=41978 RepID=UPI00287352D3|nr:hypothetical protein [Ruminococcus sp.]MBQ3285546.1 hypothetical protein [Ruminococcus sp.]